MKLIGLIGKKGSGKNAFAEAAGQYLQKGGFPEPRLMAFGDALKKEVAEKTGMTVEVINSNKRQFRPMLQWWGTEYRRTMFGADYWIKRLEESEEFRCHEMSYPFAGCNFITDVRFLDEAQFVAANGGILIRINRPDMISLDLHTSEMEMDQIKADIIVDNVGAAEAFASTARNLINGLMLEGMLK